MIILIPLSLIFLFLLFSFVCFIMVFKTKRKLPMDTDGFPLVKGKAYEKHRKRLVQWIQDARKTPYTELSITAHDGLKLSARYYEYSPDSTVEILFHGYQGSSERDLSGAICRCFALKRSAILVDQRGYGKSEGHITTFGIKERKDCRKWIEHVSKLFGKDRKIIISGVSMGAATVMMAAGEPLPDNVVCVLADCGFNSPKEIILKVMRDMNYPPKIMYPLLRFSAKLYGGFDIEEYSPMQAMKNATIPIIFIHGTDDSFVPCYMSEQLYKECASKFKRLVLIDGAGHAVCYPADEELYVNAILDFEKEYAEGESEI